MSYLKWEPYNASNSNQIIAISQWHDEGTPFFWIIKEYSKKVILCSEKELLPKPKSFKTVKEAMMWADEQESTSTQAVDIKNKKKNRRK